MNDTSSTNLQLIKNFYRTDSSVKIHHKQKKKRSEVNRDNIDNEVMEKYKGYEYIIDPSLSEYEIKSDLQTLLRNCSGTSKI